MVSALLLECRKNRLAFLVETIENTLTNPCSLQHAGAPEFSYLFGGRRR